MPTSQADPTEHSSLQQGLQPCPTPWLCPCANHPDGHSSRRLSLSRAFFCKAGPWSGRPGQQSFVLLEEL